MSGTYWLQSRIASGSQAARCFGVHCCAAAGEIANVSARAISATAPRRRSVDCSVECVVCIPIIDAPVCSLRGHLPTIYFWRGRHIAVRRARTRAPPGPVSPSRQRFCALVSQLVDCLEPCDPYLGRFPGIWCQPLHPPGPLGPRDQNLGENSRPLGRVTRQALVRE